MKKQRKKLQSLRRARTRCLSANAPPPPASPPPVVPDTGPPDLVLESPAAGTWFDLPLASLRGRASDSGSGLARVDCAGRAAVLAGDRFTCEVPLVEGANAIAVTAADGAGNTARASVTVRHGPGLLPGAEGAAAVAEVRDADTDPRHDASEIADDARASGSRAVRSACGSRRARPWRR